MHDVGTIKPSSGQRRGERLTGLDTPTLKGIWETAPYLHDGSAPTLLDVLTTANPAGLHGNTLSLSDVQLDQLVAYLLQIDELESPSLTAEVAFVSTGRRYQEGRAQVGHEYFIDRAFAISSVSPGLKGSVLLLTANDDKTVTTANHLRFTVNQPAKVFIGYDRRGTTRPAWLSPASGWMPSSETMAVTDAGASPLLVFEKQVPAGEVILGGNLQPPASGAGSSYLVLVANLPGAPSGAIDSRPLVIKRR